MNGEMKRERKMRRNSLYVLFSELIDLFEPFLGWHVPMVMGRLMLFLFVGVICSLPQLQRDSLMALYNATGGQYWAQTWSTSTDPCGPPSWFGVICIDQNVTELNLVTNNLTGTLPDLQLPLLTDL